MKANNFIITDVYMYMKNKILSWYGTLSTMTYKIILLGIISCSRAVS